MQNNKLKLKIDFKDLKNKFLKNKKTFSIVSLGVVFLILIFLVGYLYLAKIEFEQKVSQLQEEINLMRAPLEPDVPTIELWQPGQVGEPAPVEGIEKEVNDLPAVIFNTIGIVQEIKQEKVLVLGDGSNFADKQPRQLTLLFTQETNVFLADRTQYIGLTGLEYLEPGMQILINSIENMRGRTEFRVLNINVLDF